MLRRFVAIMLVAIASAFAAQSAFADPVNAKNALFVTATCGTTQVSVVVNGNGEWAPGHVIGSTAMFIPTAFDLVATFTPTGGATETETDTSTKAHPPHRALVTCELPVALNTVTFPDGTFTLSGTVTGFFTPAG